MISHGPGSVARHHSGRYLWHRIHIETDSAGCHIPGIPIAQLWRLVTNPLDAYQFGAAQYVERWLARPEWAAVADQFEVVPGPGCNCCGERWNPMQSDGEAVHRCPKHVGRNPCAVEGCKRTRATTQGHYYNDAHLCAEHFRIAAPPGSRERRVYNRLWRLHRKRDGKDAPWSPDLDRRLWRVWYRLVALARGRTVGDIDMDAINRLMGWE